VSGPLVAVHTDASLGELEVLSGLFFSADRQHLERLVEQERVRLKLFVGHSGWGSGQLESELDQGAWLTVPASLDEVFQDEQELWRSVTRKIGKEMLVSMLHIKDVPDDPTVN
jgi:putative transcriptional regulator